MLIYLLSSPDLGLIYEIKRFGNLQYLQYHNFQFFHLGTILILCGILSLYANYFPIPLVVAKVGQSTMMIYIVHIFIIYGTGINNGLLTYFGGTFEPWQSILTAASIIFGFLIFLTYSERLKLLFNNYKLKLFASGKP